MKIRVLSSYEDKEGVKESEQTLGDELIEDLIGIKEKAASVQRDMVSYVRQKKLWDVMSDLLSDCHKYLSKLEHLQLPKMCCSILKATDAGPGVGITNVEVRFRDAEISRIHSSDRVNRIHRAPGDSAQNESERTNAAIGDSLVDGTALKWEYYKPFDGLASGEIDKLSASEIKERQALCMERNAWRVAQEVAATVDDEPGPAGDFIKCYVTTCQNKQFFFNRSFLMQYAYCKTEAKKQQCPGSNYFKKIYSFIDTHFEIGEMYLEYLKGSCKISSGKLCDFCTSCEKCSGESLVRIPRPYPDHESPGLHYLPLSSTPTTNRSIDDFLPRAQLKKPVHLVNAC